MVQHTSGTPVDNEQGNRAASLELPQQASRFLIPAVVILVGVAMLVLAAALPASNVPTRFSPSWWPAALGAVTVVLGVLLAFWPENSDDEDAVSGDIRRLLLASAIIIGGVGLWAWTSFLVGGIVIGAGLLAALGERRILVLLLFPVVVTGAIWAVFALLLRVPL